MKSTRHTTRGERREKKKRPRMRVSGRGVFLIQRIRRKRAA
ncbi:MAG: hypothetical protein Q8R35_02445 [bacterium]|nr:hypothetical protein [bacterium]